MITKSVTRVWVCFICLPIPPSRIADFQDVLKEPTIVLEKLRELSFSGKRQLSVLKVFPEQHYGLNGGEGAQGHTRSVLGASRPPGDFSRFCDSELSLTALTTKSMPVSLRMFPGL